MDRNVRSNTHAQGPKKTFQLTVYILRVGGRGCSVASIQQSYLQLWVFYLMLGLVEFWLKEAAGYSQGSVSHEQHGELELRDKLT